MRRVLKSDPDAESVTTFEYDDLTDKAVINTTTNVGPRIEQNKIEFNDPEHQYLDGTRSMRKVASIPPAIYMLWLELYGIDALNRDHKPAVIRLLNSSEWRYLRTSDETI